MRDKTLLKLGALAVLLSVVGVTVLNNQDSRKAAVIEDPALFPALTDRLNDVATITVASTSGTWWVSQTESGWVLDSKGGYPVKVEEVRKTLIALSDAEKIEAKTKVASSYPRIGVEGPGQEGSESKLITLTDVDGGVLAAVVLGKRRAGAGAPSHYMRVADSTQSWLVSTDLTLSEDSDSWLDKKILELPRDRIRAVQTLHPDMEEVFVARPSEEIEQFEVHDIPEGFKLKYDAVAAGMGSALQYLNFVDVRPAEGFEFPNRTPTTTQFWTFDGLRVDVAIYSVAEVPEAETFYAVFTVADGCDGPERLKTTGPEPAPAEEGEETPTRSSEEIAAEVEELNAKVSGWVYEIAPYSKTNLSKRHADLLDPVVSEEEGSGLSDAGGLQLPGGLTIPVTEENAEAPVTETPAEDGR